MVVFDGQSDEGVVAGLWWCLMDRVMREWLLVCGGV